MPTFHYFSADGTSLCADVYPVAPESKPLAAMLLIHGYCEHRGRYRETAEHLAQAGYLVMTLDLRGHGQSGGDRAFVQRFDDYLADVAAAMAELRKLSAAAGLTGPPFLVGHSMGGLVALLYALNHPAELRALALSSPFLGIKLAVPRWKSTLAEVASLLVPRLSLPNEIRSEDLTHDPALVAAHRADQLVYPKATARWFTEALAAHQQALRRAPQLSLPVLVLQAGDDRLAAPEASRAVFDRLGSADKTFTLYPGLFHEIFNEVERPRVRADLLTWLGQRCR